MRFLLFRLPQEQDFFWLEHRDDAEKKVSFFPFVGENILSLKGKIEKIEKKQIVEKLSLIKDFPLSRKINIPSKEEYLEKINRAISELKKNQWQKIVISRPKEIDVENLDVLQTFFNLSEQFPQAFCYVWKDEHRLWIGATPELLGKFDREKSTFETMSLAGTLPIDEEWSVKELEEQQAVTNYISSVLNTYADEVEIGQTESHILGKIKHLRTNFKAKLKPEKLENLIQNLHPTPAVCGIPKEDCQRKIIEIEDFDREYYTGYIKIEIEEKTYFFVNLRCMQVFENKIVAYAGGGITEKSIAEKEWQETELKLNSILGKIKSD